MIENRMYPYGILRIMQNGGITTPVAPEGGMPADPGNVPETPVAPEGGAPADPGAVPETPIAPEGGAPVDPGVMPETPIAPEGGFPVDPGLPYPPTLPDIPVYPSPYYGQVRFLNASTDATPVTVSIDGVVYATNFRFSNITGYQWISDGFHTVTVRRANSFRTVLYQHNIPFAANERMTLVLTDTGLGLNLLQVADTGCVNMPFNSACYRVCNVSFPNSSYDVMLYSGETIFRDVRFEHVAPYKQAVAGSYQMYVTNSGNYNFAREIPVIVIGAYNTSVALQDPLVSYAVNIEAGKKYTTYLMGNNWSNNYFRAITVED